MLFWCFKKFNPKTSERIFAYIVAVVFFFKKITSSTIGVLFILISIHSYLKFFGQVKPYNFPQLMTWFIELDKDYKIATLSSSLTILGFLIAFQTATRNWKNQLTTQIKLTAASEIDNVFGNIQDAVTQISIFTNGILEAMRSAKDDPTSFETDFKIKYEVENIAKFVTERDRLTSLVNESNKIYQKHYNIFVSIPRGGEHIQKAIALSNDVLFSSWLPLPYIDKNSPSLVGDFIFYVNVEKFIKLQFACKDFSEKATFISGIVSGQLKSCLDFFNFNNIQEMFKLREQTRNYVEKVFYEDK